MTQLSIKDEKDHSESTLKTILEAIIEGFFVCFKEYLQIPLKGY